MGLFSLFSKRQAAADDPPLEAKSADAARLGALAEWIAGGVASPAGVDVTPASAMRYATVYACVRLIAESIAQLPVHLYERRADGTKRRVTEHPLSTILASRPNGWQTGFEYFEGCLTSLCLRGNHYAYKVRSGGRLDELVPLLPGAVTVTQDRDLGLRYQVRLDGGGFEEFDQAEIHHVRGLTLDGYTGISPISWQRNTIGLGVAAENHGGYLFKNGAMPAGVLSHPGSLSDEAYARIKRSWAETHGGEKKGGTAVLEEGLTYAPITMSNEDAQYLEVRQFQRTEICSIFRVPPHMIGDLTKSSFSNITQQSLEMVKYTFLPWCRRIEAAINRDLLEPRELERGLYVEFLLSGLERADIETRYKVYTSGIASGVLSANECRAKENMNPRPGGDTYLQPLNMVDATNTPANATGKGQVRAVPPPPGQLAAPPDGVLARERLRAAFAPRFLALARRLVQHETGALRELLAAEGGRTGFTIGSAEFYRSLPETIRTMFASLVREYAAAVRGAALTEIDSEDQVDLAEFADGLLAAFSARHIGSSEGQLAELLADAVDEEIAETIEPRLAEWDATRADKIAGREPVQQENAVARYVWAAVGVTKLMWQRRGSNSCPFCRALDGKIVGIDAPFVDAGDFTPDGHEASPLRVRGPKLHAPIHQGCVCAIVPVRD